MHAKLRRINFNPKSNVTLLSKFNSEVWFANWKRIWKYFLAMSSTAIFSLKNLNASSMYPEQTAVKQSDLGTYCL